ncbi:MAG: cytidylate kinase family protein [Clostridia bacterium]|nr:cytidylate kinase family protein [Clostridia bacterium]
MARIITVSRQFGSGGRELGKRLSDLLGWDYYDREIIQMLSEQQGLDPEYVHRALSSHGWH